MYNKKVLREATKNLDRTKAPAKKKDMIIDPMGQWKYPGQNTRIPSNDITMQGVPYPVWAVPNIGMPQMMYPEQNYNFPGAEYVDEYPQMQKGGSKYPVIPVWANAMGKMVKVNYPTDVWDKVVTYDKKGKHVITIQYYDIPKKQTPVKSSKPKAPPVSLAFVPPSITDLEFESPVEPKVQQANPDPWNEVEPSKTYPKAYLPNYRTGVWSATGKVNPNQVANRFNTLDLQGETFAYGGDISIPDLNQYEDGGEYDLTQEEIDDLIAQGYQVEDVDTDEYKKGGTPRSLPKKKSSKAYSRSLTATNKLFAQSPLTKKSKSRKNKIFDPNAKYFQEGGIPYNYNPLVSNEPEGVEIPMSFDPKRTTNDPEDYQQFLDYSTTAPENRRPYENYFYGNPNEYDHYGMWDALGKPKNFNQALEMNPWWEPDPYDKMYHGFSVNPNTGVFLKSGKPGLKEGDTTWMEIAGHYLSPRAQMDTPVFDPELQRFKYIPNKEKGGFQDDLGKHRKLIRDWTYGQSIGMLQRAQEGLDTGVVESRTPWTGAANVTGEETTPPVIFEGKDVTVKAQGPEWARYQREYQNANPWERYLAGEKNKYLRKNKGLNKAAGVTADNFPKDAEERIRQEYDRKMNTYTTRRLGKHFGYNPRQRGEWIDLLTPKEKEIVAGSKYGSKLQPDAWSRFMSGARSIYNAGPLSNITGDITTPIRGYTERENKEALNNWAEGMEALAPLDIPGIVIANKMKNMNAENPSWYSGEMMGNVGYGDVVAMNPLTLLDLYGLPQAGVSLGRGIAKGSKAAGKYLTTQTPLKNAYKYNPLAGRLGEYNRVVGQDAVDDILESGLVRVNENAGVAQDLGPFGTVYRQTPYPSFGKAKPQQTYADQVISQGKTPYIISTDRPMKASTLGRHGRGTTQFPVDDAGKYMTGFPASEAKVFEFGDPHWLKGYEPISTKGSTDNLRKFTTRGPIGEGVGTGLVEQDISKSVNDQINWITSEEYYKRRSANTGETYDQIYRDVNKTINNAKDAKFDVNAKLPERIQGQQTPRSLNTFWGPPTVDISSTAGNPAMVLKHEVGHLYSPAGFDTDISKLHRGFDNPDVANLASNKRGVYANYPQLGDINMDDYLQLGFEQQVRHLNARDQMLSKFNLQKDAQLTEDQVRQFVDDWSTKMNNRSEGWQDKDFNFKYGKEEDYDDLWKREFDIITKDLLKEKFGIDTANEYQKQLLNLSEADRAALKEERRQRLTKRITDVTNKAWVGVPAVIGAGVATQQLGQHPGGTFQDGGYTDVELTPEEIDWYLANGYDLEELPDDYEMPMAQGGFEIQGLRTQPVKSSQPKPKAQVKEDVVVSKQSAPSKITIEGLRTAPVVEKQSSGVTPYVQSIFDKRAAQPYVAPKKEVVKTVKPIVVEKEKVVAAPKDVFSKSKYAYQPLSGYLQNNPIVPEPAPTVNKAKPVIKNNNIVPTYTLTDTKYNPTLTVNTEESEESKVQEVNPKVKKYQGIVNNIDNDIQKVYYNLTNPALKPEEKAAARKRYQELTQKRGSYIKAINSVKRDEAGWFDVAVNESPLIGKPLQKLGFSDQPSYMNYDLPKFETYNEKKEKEDETFKQTSRFENLNPNKSEFTRWKFRATASNDDPLKVAVYGTRGERANQNVEIKSPGAIMHFLDQSPQTGYMHENTKNYYSKLKENDYVGYLKPNGDGTSSVQYKPRKEFNKNNLYKNTFLVRQVKFDDIDFKNKVKDDNFAGHTYPTIKGTKQVALPISSDPDENIYDYSSGQSVVYIFNYKGKIRYQHFAGSRSEIKKEGEELKKMYNLNNGELTIGLADAGSYSSAVSGNITNNKLNNKDYGYYNGNPNTGAGMAILPK